MTKRVQNPTTLARVLDVVATYRLPENFTLAHVAIVSNIRA